MKRKTIILIALAAVFTLLLGIAYITQTPLVIAKILWMNTQILTEMKVDGPNIIMNGPINSKTYNQFVSLLEENPQVTTLVEENMPGSIDDETMIKLAYFVREHQLNTHLRSTSKIDSGAVDLFLSGVERTMEQGAHIGVHSWSDGGHEGADFPMDAPQHEANRKYIEDMLGSDEFYWFTIYAAPADGIHEMTEDEIMRYALLTKPIIEATPPPGQMTGIMASKIFAMGNPESDTVLLLAQGGPITYLLEDELRSVFRGLDRDKLQVVNVAQTQILDPNRFTKQPIDFETAKAADAESVQLMAQMVDWYRQQGKKVYVTGISFGAFIVEDLLATQGNVADGYLIVVGRLDMPTEVWQEFAAGRMVGFKDGVTVIPVDAAGAGMGGEGEYTDANMARLAAGLGYKRYTQLLASVPLDNVVYIYGEKDDQVGCLSADEVAFLQEKEVTLISGPGTHEQTFTEYLLPGLKAMMGDAYQK